MNILITGGASGLGEAITRKLLSDGAHRVWFTYARSGDRAKELEALSPDARAVRCDFSAAGDLERLAALIGEIDIDVLINNASTGYTQDHFHKLKPDLFAESFRVNVLPVLRVTQQAIRVFRKKQFGKIITVLTAALINRPPVGWSEYVANKAYLASMSRSWAAENARFNITANCVSPSLMRTGLTGGIDERVMEELEAGHPLGRLLTTGEVADVVYFLVGATQQINGVTIPVNAGTDIL